jgi:hypothetical protein
LLLFVIVYSYILSIEGYTSFKKLQQGTIDLTDNGSEQLATVDKPTEYSDKIINESSPNHIVGVQLEGEYYNGLLIFVIFLKEQSTKKKVAIICIIGKFMKSIFCFYSTI